MQVIIAGRLQFYVFTQLRTEFSQPVCRRIFCKRNRIQSGRHTASIRLRNDCIALIIRILVRHGQCRHMICHGLCQVLIGRRIAVCTLHKAQERLQLRNITPGVIRETCLEIVIPGRITLVIDRVIVHRGKVIVLELHICAVIALPFPGFVITAVSKRPGAAFRQVEVILAHELCDAGIRIRPEHNDRHTLDTPPHLGIFKHFWNLIRAGIVIEHRQHRIVRRFRAGHIGLQNEPVERDRSGTERVFVDRASASRHKTVLKLHIDVLNIIHRTAGTLRIDLAAVKAEGPTAVIRINKASGYSLFIALKVRKRRAFNDHIRHGAAKCFNNDFVIIVAHVVPLIALHHHFAALRIRDPVIHDLIIRQVIIIHPDTVNIDTAIAGTDADRHRRQLTEAFAAGILRAAGADAVDIDKYQAIVRLFVYGDRQADMLAILVLRTQHCLSSTHLDRLRCDFEADTAVIAADQICAIITYFAGSEFDLDRLSLRLEILPEQIVRDRQSRIAGKPQYIIPVIVLLPPITDPIESGKLSGNIPICPSIRMRFVVAASFWRKPENKILCDRLNVNADLIYCECQLLIYVLTDRYFDSCAAGRHCLIVEYLLVCIHCKRCGFHIVHINMDRHILQNRTPYAIRNRNRGILIGRSCREIAGNDRCCISSNTAHELIVQHIALHVCSVYFGNKPHAKHMRAMGLGGDRYAVLLVRDRYRIQFCSVQLHMQLTALHLTAHRALEWDRTLVIHGCIKGRADHQINNHDSITEGTALPISIRDCYAHGIAAAGRIPGQINRYLALCYIHRQTCIAGYRDGECTVSGRNLVLQRRPGDRSHTLSAFCNRLGCPVFQLACSHDGICNGTAATSATAANTADPAADNFAIFIQ